MHYIGKGSVSNKIEINDVVASEGVQLTGSRFFIHSTSDMLTTWSLSQIDLSKATFTLYKSSANVYATSAYFMYFTNSLSI